MSGPGFVDLNLAHPDQKKNQEIFEKAETTLDGAIIATGAPTVDDASDFLEEVAGPDGSFDSSIKFYVRIDDEIIQYKSLSGNTLVTVTRGALGTTAASHDDGANVETLIGLEGDAMVLALKLMLSGVNGNFTTAQPVTNFVQIGDASEVANSIFFSGVDVEDKYGLVEGDFLTTTGAANASNNVSAKTISDINVDSSGSYIVVDSVTFTTETDTSATISFRSQYDTLGEGLGMSPDEVDVAQHELLDSQFLTGFDYRFLLKEAIDGKEFLNQEIYRPYACYSVPRQARASVQYTIGPIPGVEIKTFDKTNIRNPGQIKLRRTIGRHFYNTVVYKFEESALEDKFLSGRITTDTDSTGRISVGNKVFRIESKGMRDDLLGQTRAQQSSSRILNRYKFAAEQFERLRVFFKDGFNVEVGDVHIIDPTDLHVSNTKDGTRVKPAKFFEIVNKKLNLKTGEIDLTLVDTNFEADERYGLVSPSSFLTTGSTTTQLVVTESFGASNESEKWEDYVGLPIRVHSEDYSFDEETTLQSIDANVFTVSPALSVSPPAGYVIDIPQYPTTTSPDTNRFYKLVHAHFSPQVGVVSGASTTVFDVGAGDVGKFFVGSIVEVHNEDYTTVSPETEVIDVTGTTITVKDDLGFIPSSSELVDFIGFADEEPAYRVI